MGVCLAPGCAFAQEEHTESGATGRVGLKNQQDMEQFFERALFPLRICLAAAPAQEGMVPFTDILSLSHS